MKGQKQLLLLQPREQLPRCFTSLGPAGQRGFALQRAGAYCLGTNFIQINLKDGIELVNVRRVRR